MNNSDRRNRILSVSVTVVFAVAIFCQAASISQHIFISGRLFDRADLALPALTQWVLGLPTGFPLLMAFVLVVIMIGKEFISDALARVQVAVILLVLCLFLNTFLTIGMNLPMIALISSVAGGGG